MAVVREDTFNRMNDLSHNPWCLFALRSGTTLGQRVAAALGVSLCPVEERDFDAGEHKTRPLAEVRGRECWVVAALHGDAQESVNDRLCRLMFFVSALRDAGASAVTVCAPYLPYARKDRRTKPRDPVTTRYLAQLLEAAGVDRIVTLEVHNPAAFDNAFRCESVRLGFAPLLARHLDLSGSADPIVLLSPDVGGIKRAQLARELFEARAGRPIGLGFMEKRRSAGIVSGDRLVGDVAGRQVLILDDLISSGGTMLRAVAACRAAGAGRIDVAACHAVFTPEAQRLFTAAGPDAVIVSDSVPVAAPEVASRLVLLDSASWIAEAIDRLRRGVAIEDMTGATPG
jgi:ribose-phosphate pyrophosphokinase